jgi:GRAM domain
MKTTLLNNEALIKQGPANLHRKIETVGGKLYLTNLRLIFEAHQFNIQTERSEIALSDVASITKSWTKFLGFLPIFPNSISLLTQQGQEFRFVLFGRDTWITEIMASVGKSRQ